MGRHFPLVLVVLWGLSGATIVAQQDSSIVNHRSHPSFRLHARDDT
jgi:hypothetical protein